MGGVVLRCTAKMLSLLNARPRDLVTVEPSDRDWYANVLWLDGRTCLLLAHAGTLFSVFVPDLRKADLVPIGASVVGFIQKELGAESLPLDRFGVLDPHFVVLAKTESRTILGYMNEMAWSCKYAVEDAGGLGRCDARELNRELRRELTCPGSRRDTSSRSNWPADPAAGHRLGSSIDFVRDCVPLSLRLRPTFFALRA